MASILLAVPPAPAESEPAPRFFPLEEGYSWTYGGEFRLGEFLVVRRRGDVAVMRHQITIVESGRVDWGPIYYWLVDRGDEIDIDLPEEGPQPYYRFEEDSFVHWDVTDNARTACMNGVEVTVVSRTERVDTPAGVFEPCTVLRYGDLNCEYGVTEEWWYRGAGLVYWSYNAFAGPSDWYLIDFWVGPRFVRGDIQGDGRVDIGDPIALLGYLFLGATEPPCLDAADADDSGALELSDGIHLLQWLFAAGAPLPCPATTDANLAYPARDCGNDTTSDGLDCGALATVCR